MTGEYGAQQAVESDPGQRELTAGNVVHRLFSPDRTSWLINASFSRAGGVALPFVCLPCTCERQVSSLSARHVLGFPECTSSMFLHKSF
jgi:hypothetical protein